MKDLKAQIEAMQAEKKLPTQEPHPVDKPDYWQEREAVKALKMDDCSTCGGMGVIKYAVPPDHPSFGKFFPCPKNCATVQQNRANRAHVIIDIMRRTAGSEVRGLYKTHPDDRHKKPEERRALTLESLRGFGIDTQKTAWELCNQFANTAPTVTISHNGAAKNSLVLYGDKGYGKTLLVSALVNTLESRQIPVFGARLYDIVKRVNSVYEKTRAANSPYDERPEFSSIEILSAFTTFPILVIDEFELTNVTDSRMDIVEELINSRYVAGLPTLITTNLNADGLRKVWNARIADRIADSYWFYKVQGARLRDDFASSEIKL